VTTAIADLAKVRAHLPECLRLNVLEVVLGGAGRTLRCLYPEPGAARVEDQLMRLVLTAKVDGREDLNIEEVG